MTKVLFIAYFFPPVSGAGVQRAEKFVHYLPAEGFLPVIITARTSSENRWTPHDRSLMNSIPPEVPIHRVESAPPKSSSKMRNRLGRWAGVPSSFARWWIPAASELGLRVADGELLIFTTMSPFESGEVARRLSARLGVPWVADLRDPWALDEMLVYPSLLHRRLEMMRMQRLLATASLIIMNTPESSRVLKATFPRLRKQQVLTITNGFDPADFAGPVTPRTDGKFRIVHTGYLHTDNGTQLRKRRFVRLLGGAEPGVDILTRSHTVLLDALEQWCVQRPEVREKLEIVFAGKTSEQDRAVANVSKVAPLIKFPGFVAHHESVALLRTADLLFLPMHNLPAGRLSRIVPGKTYEYMAAGRPILAAVPEGDAREFLKQCGTALICNPDDAAGMVQILDRVYSAWSRRESFLTSNHAFISQFGRPELTRTLAAAFHSLLPDNKKECECLACR